jgi:serine/threonine protein kinase
MDFFDDFKVEGPNGTHQCIVTEVLGPSIGADVDEIYDEEWYPIEMAKMLVAQVIRGVAYLRSCGVVHGGKPSTLLRLFLLISYFTDLHIGNILLRIPGIEQIAYQDLQKYLGEPYKRPLLARDGKPVTSTPHKPKYVVASPEPLEVLQLCLSSPEAVHVKICDFGESFLRDVKPVITRLNTPCIYAAPEIIFHDPVSPAVDVWALAILIHIVLSGGSFLFDSYYRRS